VAVSSTCCVVTPRKSGFALSGADAGAAAACCTVEAAGADAASLSVVFFWQAASEMAAAITPQLNLIVGDVMGTLE
jgi:hypothetical protein